MIDGATPPPLLQMRGIGKSFPGVRALDGVDLVVERGEVVALLGENGAGKSTLIKILGGAHQPDQGSISIDGQPVSIAAPIDGQRLGISIIYQEFNLIPALKVWENLFLGQEQRPWVRAGSDRRRAQALLDRMGVSVPVDARCQELSVAQQQVVEIAKAIALEARILVMDEPTAALSLKDTERLFEVIRELRERGIAVIYISHRLEEIEQICDRIEVLRDGSNAGGFDRADVEKRVLIERMVGRELKDEFPARDSRRGAVRLKVRDLRRGESVRGVDLEIHAGEILGLTGLVGAGRTEAARLIAGADRRDAGTVTLDGRELPLATPGQAIRDGICLLTEDRKQQGLILGQSVLHNFGLKNLSRFSRWQILQQRREREQFGTYVDQIRVRISSPKQTAGTLSGGNQQKVVLAAWLERNCDVLIFDEPTRGIDVGARYEIYQLMHRLADAGKAILMISSELPEVLGMSDRILVMHRGRIAGEITDVNSATQEQILHLAVGEQAPESVSP